MCAGDFKHIEPRFWFLRGNFRIVNRFVPPPRTRNSVRDCKRREKANGPALPFLAGRTLTRLLGVKGVHGPNRSVAHMICIHPPGRQGNKL